MTSSSPDRRVHAVQTGAELLLTEAAGLIRGKRIGILTNHTGRLPDGTPLADAVCERRLAKVVALFSPEHGLAGNVPDGTSVENTRHPRHRIPIHSLYGTTHKPTPAMLENLDVLVCDLQDIGARFYTYVSTVALALEAAAECRVRCIIADRPNPIRGIHFDGPLRDESLRSFVGWLPIPVTHGLTLGELARLANEEGWLASGIRAELEVVRLKGWKRSMWYDDTGLPWVPPSPNMPCISTAALYPGMCFLEGTSVSEGRGSDSPFELVGAPWVDPDRVLRHFSELRVPGVTVRTEDFTPRDIPGVATHPKYAGEVCHGIRLELTDRDAVQPVRLGIALLTAFKRAHPTDMELRNRRFDILTGSRSVRSMLERGAPLEEIFESWEANLKAFGRLRQHCLLYT